jgi:NAD dependent epimerase/dehydratase family enzyme
LVGRGVADELVLASARIEPRVLERSGFVFRHPTISDAIAHLLG